MGWRSRGYLPHFDQPGLCQSITFRLHDSVPKSVIEQWHEELTANMNSLASMVDGILRQRFMDYEDAGHGQCWLRNPQIATSVEDALLYFDGEQYRLLAWCVMPNHAHVLIETLPSYPLSQVVHSWKSFTAKQANTLLGRNGIFWVREYYDRFIRNDRHLTEAINYIEQNPVKAGLVQNAKDWRFSSAYHDRRRLL